VKVSGLRLFVVGQRVVVDAPDTGVWTAVVGAFLGSVIALPPVAWVLGARAAGLGLLGTLVLLAGWLKLRWQFRVRIVFEPDAVSWERWCLGASVQRRQLADDSVLVHSEREHRWGEEEDLLVVRRRCHQDQPTERRDDVVFYRGRFGGSAVAQVAFAAEVLERVNYLRATGIHRDNAV
jgi:hypothetical protein